MSEEQDKRLTQLRQAYEAGILDEQSYRSTLAALGLSTQTSAQVGDEGVAAQNGAVAAREIAVGRDVQGNVILINVNAGAADAQALLRALSTRPVAPDRPMT